MTDGKYKQRSETGHCKPIFGAPIGLYFGDAAMFLVGQLS
jgi:hypothetical protein